MALSRPLKEDHLALPPFYASLLQARDCVMPLALCPQVVSQAPLVGRPEVLRRLYLSEEGLENVTFPQPHADVHSPMSM